MELCAGDCSGRWGRRINHPHPHHRHHSCPGGVYIPGEKGPCPVEGGGCQGGAALGLCGRGELSSGSFHSSGILRQEASAPCRMLATRQRQRASFGQEATSVATIVLPPLFSPLIGDVEGAGSPRIASKEEKPPAGPWRRRCCESDSIQRLNYSMKRH